MKRRRSAPKGRPTKKARVVPATVVFPGPGRQQQMFVARSFGNPRAITERKYYTNSKNATAITDLATADDWTGTELDITTVNCLFAPATGDDFNTRDGRKVQVLAIKIRGLLSVPSQANQTGADEGCAIRLVLYQDKQTNAAQAQGEDVLAGTATTTALNAFQNPANFGRFRVLKDKTYTLQNPAMTYDGTNVEQNGLKKPFKLNHKFKKPVTVHFNGTNGGTVADIVDHSFHLIGGYFEGGLAPTIAYQVRVTFIDV